MMHLLDENNMRNSQPCDPTSMTVNRLNDRSPKADIFHWREYSDQFGVHVWVLAKRPRSVRFILNTGEGSNTANLEAR